MGIDNNKRLKISILGDSYSTFEGFVSPSTNAIWYPAQNKANDVANVNQTWWYMLLKEYDAVLEKNNSYSGATICNTGYNRMNSSVSSYVTRMKNLGDPDLIIILGGTNDSWADSPIGSYKYNDWTDDDLKNFRPAFGYMLDYIVKQYPQARVINVINTDLKRDISDAQTFLCSYYEVECIQLNNIEKQSGHPSIKGMISIKDQILSVIANTSSVFEQDCLGRKNEQNLELSK